MVSGCVGSLLLLMLPLVSQVGVPKQMVTAGAGGKRAYSLNKAIFNCFLHRSELARCLVSTLGVS